MPTQKKIWKNKLYFGDNLDILKDKISDNFVDLIYLDPPFKSGRNYNIIFQSEVGEIKGATAQIQTFEDTWNWGEEAEKNYDGLIEGVITKEKPNQKLIDLMKSLRSYLGECPTMAYLSMMAPRLLELRRVLRNEGSIYLHCDPTASHYLKLIMDAIFGAENFLNEIVWYYPNKIPDKRKKIFTQSSDRLLFYAKKRGEHIFNLQEEKRDHPIKVTKMKKVKGKKVYVRGEDGKVITIVRDTRTVDDIWKVPMLMGQAERIGYPTQKPEKLLERIIKASSRKESIVLDPFCGCGTSLAVAERLNRKWIGIDITYLAISVISNRLENSKIKQGVDFEIDGEPKDVYSANKLAKQDPFQFQIWCVTKLDAAPSQTKTGDQGVDGIINFLDPSKPSRVGKAIIQIKGTENINPSMVRDLKGTMKSQDADFSILVTLKKPTRGMIVEATKEKSFKFMGKNIPKIQLLNVEDLFKDPIPVKLPQMVLPPYKKPVIEKELPQSQKNLF